MNIHIGEKIKSIVEKRGITKAELARRLNMSSTNVHKIFNRKSIDTGLLTGISRELEYDFFSYYENLPAAKKSTGQKHFQEEAGKYKSNPAGLSNEIVKLREEIARKEKEIEFANKEIAYLKRINELLMVSRVR